MYFFLFQFKAFVAVGHISDGKLIYRNTEWAKVPDILTPYEQLHIELLKQHIFIRNVMDLKGDV